MKTALVSGANRGIGFAIAAGLTKRGDIRVLVASRNRLDAESAAAKIASPAVGVALDLAGNVDEQIKAIVKRHGHIDILVNNAGVLEYANLLEVEQARLDESLQINFMAPLQLIRRLVPEMNAGRYGRIVNVSSGWGSFAEGLSGPASYSVSKAALNALTLSLAKDLSKNVKINSMCPGWVRTRMGGSSAPRTPEEGADTALWLATLPEDGPNGGFYRERRLIEW